MLAGDPEIIDKINVLANDHVGKWGGALGSAPVQLTYSITDAGALTYSDVQLGEYSLYEDLHTYSASSALNALAFSAADVPISKQHLTTGLL